MRKRAGVHAEEVIICPTFIDMHIIIVVLGILLLVVLISWGKINAFLAFLVMIQVFQDRLSRFTRNPAAQIIERRFFLRHFWATSWSIALIS